MKNMGLRQLYLVKPRKHLGLDAISRASGANHILEEAVVCQSLAEALEGAELIYATTARKRSLEWPQYKPREAAEKIARTVSQTQIALVFGRERSGLTNGELDHCQAAIHIPTDPDFSSLNLAAAVQLMAYEIRMAATVDLADENDGEPLASHEVVEQMHEHLQQTLVDIDFLDRENPRQLVRRLKRFFAKARPTVSEVQIFRGILTAVNQVYRKQE